MLWQAVPSHAVEKQTAFTLARSVLVAQQAQQVLPILLARVYGRLETHNSQKQ